MKVIRLESISSPGAAPYARLTEARLRQAGEGGGLFIAESVNVIAAALEAGHEPVSFLAEEKRIPRLAEAFGALLPDTPVFTASPAVLEGVTGFALSRGVLCAMKRKPLPSPEEAVRGASRIAVLEGLVDPTNVGAIFRSAAALGMDAVLVSSSCCDPLHRRAARVSMGAVFKVPWAVLPCLASDNLSADLPRLRSLGFASAAMALRSDAIRVDDPRLLSEERLAVLIGSEGNGLTEATVSASDYRAIIPMSHGVESLNAAAASAVAFWVLGNREKSE